MKTFTKLLAGVVTILALAMIGCQTDTDTHEHTYSSEWTSDATSHWHAATCGHDVKSDEAAHTFDEGVKTCSVCEYKKTEAIPVLPSTQAVFVKIAGTEITGKETWTPKSEVFVSGRAITIPTLLVSDHEVTRGEFKDVMGNRPK